LEQVNSEGGLDEVRTDHPSRCRLQFDHISNGVGQNNGCNRPSSMALHNASRGPWHQPLVWKGFAMQRFLQPLCRLLPLCFALVGCGGGGGSVSPPSTPAPVAPPPTFRDISIPSGFSPGTASIKLVQVTAAKVMAEGGLPLGYEDPRVYTWVTFSYTDAAGQARTLSVMRWTALAALGTSGLRFELPSQVSRLQYQVYNANGSKSGSFPS
jgi:hypothetical protein